MPARVIVTGIVLVVMVVMLIFFVEFFLPLSIKSDMNMICRNTLLKMEVEGGLLEQEKNGLQVKLQEKGLVGVTISGTDDARQGGLLNLHVEAEYRYKSLIALFSRTNTIQRMIYDKTSMSRKVTN